METFVSRHFGDDLTGVGKLSDIATRFNPSVNGPLHLGHIYTALVNESFAQEHSGRFYVRWDDSHPLRVEAMGVELISRILEQQRYDMDWLGFTPHDYIKQSKVVDEVRAIISKQSAFRVLRDEPEPILARLISDGYMMTYPLTSMLTAEKVIMDSRISITHLIRGLDLFSEFSLYQYYCRCLELPQPKHIYLPRLKWQHGNMSKTLGSLTIANLRHNGYTPEDIRQLLSEACLLCPFDGWHLYNLKPAPYVDL